MASYTIGPEDVCLWYSDTHLRMPEFQKTLQRQDFPRATRVLLEWLHRYFVQCENFPPGKFPNQDCVRQLIEEFVFYRNSGTSRVQQKPTAIQELRLLEELCNHFQLSKALITRHNVFEAFFGCKPGPTTSADEHRMAALSKLVSMAIAVNCIPVLDCAAVLIHNQGACEATLSLTQSLIEDFCTLIPSAGDLLRQLVDSSPQFVCQFMASISALYDVDRDPKKRQRLPPISLLEVLAFWTSKHPLIFIEHLLNPPLSIPSFHGDGVVSPDPLPGPFPGLIRACILSPLLAPDSCAADSGGLTPAGGVQAHLLLSRLHLRILQALLSTQQRLRRRPALPKSEDLVRVADIEAIVKSLRRLMGGVGRRPKEGGLVAVALDRLAQVVQVTLSSGTLRTTRGALKSIFADLPNNQLITLVLNHEEDMQS